MINHDKFQPMTTSNPDKLMTTSNPDKLQPLTNSHKLFDHKWLSAIVMLGSLLFCSCAKLTPQDLQTKIDDCVRYRMAVINTMINRINDVASQEGDQSEEVLEALMEERTDIVDKYDDKILELWGEKETDFLTLLSLAANDPNNEDQEVASELLQAYQDVEIDLSDYRSISSSMFKDEWEFTENISGVVFDLTIVKTTGYWSIQAQEESITNYFQAVLEVE